MDEQGRIRVYAERDIRRNGIALLLSMEQANRVQYIHTVTFGEAPPDEGICGTKGLFLSYEDAQSLMDELWNARVRPSDGLSTDAERRVFEMLVQTQRAESDFLKNLVRHQMGIV